MSHRALLTLCDGCLILEHLVWILRRIDDMWAFALQAGLSTCSFLIIQIILALSPPIYQDRCVGAAPDLGPGTYPRWGEGWWMLLPSRKGMLGQDACT